MIPITRLHPGYDDIALPEYVIATLPCNSYLSCSIFGALDH